MKGKALYLENNEQAVSLFVELWDKETLDTTESVYVVFLNKQSRKVLHHGQYGKGDRNSTPVLWENILRTAVAKDANAIMIAHNHPSANSNPSEADYLTTQELFIKCAVLGIELIDHYIIANQPKQYTPLLSHSHHSEICLKRYSRFEGIMNDASYESAVLRFVDKFCQQTSKSPYNKEKYLSELTENINRVYTKFFDPLLN